MAELPPQQRITVKRHRTIAWRGPQLLLCLLFVRCSVVSTQTDTSFGYSPTTDVSKYLKLALDIQDMRVTTDLDAKRSIYENGKHSTISLASLSLTAAATMSEVPIYNLYLYAYRELGIHHEDDSVGSFDGKPVEQYADTLVGDLLELRVERIQATATLVHHITMAYWSFLWKVLLSCGSSNDMHAALDAAVALYVGEGQVRNDSQGGYMLYSLAQFVGTQFGQATGTGEVQVNTQAMNLFVSLQQDIRNDVCATDAGYRTMRTKVRSLMKLTNIVLIQLLIHYVQDVVTHGLSSDFVELVALAINPQVASCHTELYSNLTELTVSRDVTDSAAVIQTVQQGYSCLQITCAQVGAYQDNVIPACTLDDKISSLASYQPMSLQVQEIAHLDRDISHMNIFMKLGRWSLAREYYIYGWNTNFSLFDLANGVNEQLGFTITTSDDWQLYTDYDTKYNPEFGGTAAKLINFTLDGDGTALSDDTRIGLTSGSLETSVVWLGAAAQFRAALDSCTAGKTSDAVDHWDNGVAFFIGSAEGERVSGQEGGQSIFAISKRFCGVFDTCEPSSSEGDTVSLAAMDEGSTSIRSNACEGARTIYSDKVQPFALIPIVQGFIFYSVEVSREQSDADSKGYLIAYTTALLPYVEKANAESSLLFKSNIELDGEINLQNTLRGLRSAIPAMNIDCVLIGEIQIDGNKTNLCTDGSTLPPVPTAPTAPTSPPSVQPIYAPLKPDPDGLAWGRYTFVNATVAMNDANFTLDVHDMYFSDTAQDAENIYLNASKYVSNGLYMHEDVKSLQDFSNRASIYMNEDPVYNFFRFALFDDDSFDTDSSGVENGWPYADAVEQLALGPTNGNNAQLGAKVVAVMEFYMMILHRLYVAFRQCQMEKGVPELIDAAVGLWIGQEQGEGKFNSGWSMYAVGQDAAEFYDRPEGESPVNSDLMLLFNEAQSLTKTCSTDRQAVTKLRPLVEKIARTLSIPLLQHLLFHMSDNNLQYVELYALSFIPLVVSVDEGAFSYLRDALFEGFNWETTVDDDFLSVLGKVLRAMRFSCDDLGNVTSSNEKLQSLVDVLCDEILDTYNTTYLAGFETSVDVTELARIDLDVHQIDIFLRVNAVDLAYDVYKHGRNSMASGDEMKALGDEMNSLQLLATSMEISAAGDLLDAYQGYYPQEFYADTIVSEALGEPSQSRFKNFSRRQLSEAVRRILQVMVVYLQMHGLLRSAIDLCNSNAGKDQSQYAGEAVAGQVFVDQAVALYVGSIEGPFSRGSALGSGRMMYALGKELCPLFSTCDQHGDAYINVLLLFGFSTMKENLDDFRCDDAEKVLEDTILTSLPIPLIQGTLYFSGQDDDLSLVSGDVLAETLLPQLDEVSMDTAQTIFDYTNVDLDDLSVGKNDTEVLFEAFRSVVDDLGVDCNFIGTLVVDSGNFSVCEYGVLPSNTTTDLADDLYVITTDVQDKANIALDIESMREDLSLNRLSAAKSVYSDGQNSKVYDDQGKLVDIQSIASFSTTANVEMKSNPMFQIALYALQDASGMYLGRDVSQYADAIVQEMFEKGEKSKALWAVDAALSLNVWMKLANELFQVVAKCRSENLVETDGIHLIDGAVAYWIGDGQVSDTSAQGNLLYAFAEQMSENFQVSSAGQQSRTNVNILRQFYAAKSELSATSICTSGSDTAPRLRRIVDNIISLMLVVNIQALIHYLLVGGERERVRIYAHAVVPLIAGCSPTTFQFLKGKLLEDSYTDGDAVDIVSAIRSTFPCFGLWCDDVGVHFSEATSACTDPSPTTNLADYKPSSDVREYAKFDLDILELDILLQRQAYDAAYELYSFGKHATLGTSGGTAETSLSLESLATSSGLSVVPEQASYIGYFSGDPNYADTKVRSALESLILTDNQRRAQVLGVSQYMIVFVATLESMYTAVESCVSAGDSRDGSAALHWDRAAAFIIGHLEGSSEGGSSDGRMIWGLSKKLCKEFGTCSDEEATSTRTNDRITTYLYSGRGAVLDGSCDELQKVAGELSTLLVAPIFQALFSTTTQLVQSDSKDKEALQTEAYVYAIMLLPLISKVDPNVAKTIQDNYPLEGTALRNGLVTTANALISAMGALSIPCQYVGANMDIDSCTGSVSSHQTGRIIGWIVGSLALAAAVYLFYYRRARRKAVESAPVFTLSKEGELNHHSELICSRTEPLTSSPRSSDSETELHDASDAMEEDEGMGLAQTAIRKVDDGDAEYVLAIATALNGEAQIV
jgi:hypothetical protein